MTALLEIAGLNVALPGDGGSLSILDGFSLAVPRGGALGVVGESGSGKSTAFLAALRLLPAKAAISATRLRFRDDDLLALEEPALRRIRGRHLSMVFQDAAASLNPYLTIGRQLTEVREVHFGASAEAARAAALEALAAAALPDPNDVFTKYPHELSGGQRQRTAIAMAIVGEPALLVADEPTTALDASTQTQIMALAARLRRERALSLVWISHDLGAVAEIADRVAVVYAGRVVEEAAAAALVGAPRHPYTAALLASAPSPGEPLPRRLPAIPGTPPKPGAPRGGCAFAPRCPKANDRCRREAPPETLEGDGAAARRFACFDPLGVAP